MYIAYNKDCYLIAFKSRKDLIQGIMKSNNFVVDEFKVSGYSYQQKKYSAEYQCNILLDYIREYEYSIETLLIIVGWIQRTANSFGLVKSLNKEEIKLWNEQ